MIDSMYREHILELYKHPRNFGNLENFTHASHLYNASCGDDITIRMILENGVVREVKFTGRGCALFMASASLLTSKIKNMGKKEIMKITPEESISLLKIPVSSVRMKCALLPLEAIQKAVGG